MLDRKTNRMSSFDYSNSGAYFLTICCHEKKHFFGEISKKEMVINDIGTIAGECWKNIPSHFES